MRITLERYYSPTMRGLYAYAYGAGNQPQDYSRVILCGSFVKKTLGLCPPRITVRVERKKFAGAIRGWRSGEQQVAINGSQNVIFYAADQLILKVVKGGGKNMDYEFWFKISPVKRKPKTKSVKAKAKRRKK